ncbi:response regulator [Limibacter armeniacum]|uniref:response regulator n=1 Tax=Limibacter armeniacum TaxID=466084 RepID=UPI002FE5F0D9
MGPKINSILLIDDNDSTNFLNELIIERAAFAKSVVTLQSGPQALNYLKQEIPDLILLDANMPGMSGWKFMEEYRKLDTSKQNKIVVIMLTTSINPDDKEKANSIPEINGFKNKPLSPEILFQIYQEHFV